MEPNKKPCRKADTKRGTIFFERTKAKERVARKGTGVSCFQLLKKGPKENEGKRDGRSFLCVSLGTHSMNLCVSLLASELCIIGGVWGGPLPSLFIFLLRLVTWPRRWLCWGSRSPLFLSLGDIWQRTNPKDHWSQHPQRRDVVQWMRTLGCHFSKNKKDLLFWELMCELADLALSKWILVVPSPTLVWISLHQSKIRFRWFLSKSRF